MTHNSFNQIVVIGSGMMGTSLALAIRKNLPNSTLIALTRNPKRCAEIETLKLYDQIYFRPEDCIKQTDLFILCGPINTYRETIENLINVGLDKKQIVMDIGSVKNFIVQNVIQGVEDKISFVPCHPMAGSEKSGQDAAVDNLYQDAICVLTPTKNTLPHIVESIDCFWKLLGAVTMKMDPEKHDQSVAHLSHLPHILSFCLMHSLGHRNADCAGPSWKDLERLSRSNSQMWQGIVQHNKKEVIQSIHDFQKELEQVSAWIQSDQFEKLGDYFEQSKHRSPS